MKNISIKYKYLKNISKRGIKLFIENIYPLEMLERDKK